MIAITGATGNLGKATLSFLVKKTDPTSVVAIVRDPSKLQEYAAQGVQVRKGDYDDMQSLVQALQGCDSLLQVSSAIYGEQADRQERNVVEAAKKAGVKRVVYTSTLNPGQGKHFRAAITCGGTEEAIKASGMRYSFFRNSMYMETIPVFIGNAIADGQIYYPAADGRISFASRLDMAEALANELLHKDADNAVYHITGEEAVGFETIASLLKTTKGLDAQYVDIPNEAFSAILAGIGMPEQEIGFYISMADSIKANEFERVSDDLEKLLGRKRLSLQEFVKTL